MFFGSNECDRIFVAAADIDEQIAAIERTFLIAGAIELGDSAQLLSNMQKETGYNFPSLRRSLNIKSNVSENSVTVTHEVVAYDRYTIDNNEYYQVDRAGKTITTFINGKAKRFDNAWDVKKRNGYHTAFQKKGQLVRRIWGPYIPGKLFKSADHGQISPRIFSSAVVFGLSLNLVLNCQDSRHKSFAVSFAEKYFRVWQKTQTFKPVFTDPSSPIVGARKAIGETVVSNTFFVQKLEFLI
jgi:hypothetical protein